MLVGKTYQAALRRHLVPIRCVTIFRTKLYFPSIVHSKLRSITPVATKVHVILWSSEEGGGENDTFMDLPNFGDDEIWLGFLVGGQLDDLDFGLSEAKEALDVGGRHLGSHGIQCGLYEDDEEEPNLMIFG